MDSDLHQSSETKLVAESVIERLKATGQFSDEQLTLVSRELQSLSLESPSSEMAIEAFPSGTTIGKYRLAELLGQGGAGYVLCC